MSAVYQQRLFIANDNKQEIVYVLLVCKIVWWNTSKGGEMFEPTNTNVNEPNNSNI